MYVRELKVGELYYNTLGTFYCPNPCAEFCCVETLSGFCTGHRIMLYLGEQRDPFGYLERVCLVGDKKYWVYPPSWKHIEPVENIKSLEEFCS